MFAFIDEVEKNERIIYMGENCKVLGEKVGEAVAVKSLETGTVFYLHNKVVEVIE